MKRNRFSEGQISGILWSVGGDSTLAVFGQGLTIPKYLAIIVVV